MACSKEVVVFISYFSENVMLNVVLAQYPKPPYKTNLSTSLYTVQEY